MTTSDQSGDDAESAARPARPGGSVRIGRPRRSEDQTPPPASAGSNDNGRATDGHADTTQPRADAHVEAQPAPPGEHGEDSPDGGVSPSFHIRELRQGHMPGERYVRVHRPFHETFREMSGGTLVAR